MRKGLYEEVFVHAASYKNICVLRSILLTVVSLFTLMAFGQTVHENTGWFAWFNSYKFSAHWVYTLTDKSDQPMTIRP